MTKRDDFPQKVKDSLAKRAGFRCSFPNCSEVTVGPSREGPEATSSTGVAAHIVAASTGNRAKRVDSSLSSQQRRSIKNGIWMCQTHGKLIDDDEKRFTIPQLIRWRELAELRAELDHAGRLSPQDLQKSFHNLGPAEFEITLGALGNENQIIGESLEDSSVSLVWGKNVADSVRDFAIEMARNAFNHGGANKFEILVDARAIKLIDDGNEFNSWSFLEKSTNRVGGGALAFTHIAKSLMDKIVLSSKRTEKGENEIILSLLKMPEEIMEITPCSIRLSRSDLINWEPLSVMAVTGCHVIYILLPDFFTISDIYLLSRKVEEIKNSNKKIVFVVGEVSEIVMAFIRRDFPESRFLRVPSHT